MFENCTSLTYVCMPMGGIQDTTFSNCPVLRTLVLPNVADNVVTLANSQAFKDTMIKTANNGSGIYVPKALLSNYKTATNWVTLSNYIYAIEDYPDITGGES